MLRDLLPQPSTQPPVELLVRAKRIASGTGQNSLDLFGGSGSMLVDYKQTGCKAFLRKLDAPCCDVIVQR